MIVLILLSCFTIMVSTVPVCPTVLPPLFLQEGATQAQATNTQMPAPLSPNVEQPQPGVPQQPGPHGGPMFLFPTQHYTWPPLGEGPIMTPLQPSVYGSQPEQQQPLIFPPYRYFPLFSSPYRNQLFSPYGYPMILESPLPQTPAKQPLNSPVLSAETPSGARPPTGDPPQPVKQQQNQQLVYMVQQPKSSPLGSLSSEELQMAAEMGQLSVYLTTLLTNSPAGAVQPVSQAAGIVNPEQQGNAPTAGTSSAVVPQTPAPASSGPQPNTNRVPAGMERATQEPDTVQTPVEAKLQPTQANLV